MSDPHLLRVMWGYQEQFRLSLDLATRRALERIGADLAPEAYVVGLATDGQDSDHVALEPLDRAGPGFAARDFDGVQLDVKRRYAESPVHAAGFASGELRDGWLEYAEGSARAAAVEAALEAAPAGAGRAFFVGRPAQVGGYSVHPVIGVDQAALNRLPRLEVHPCSEVTTPPGESDVRTTPSLSHGVIGELLRTATHALLAAKPPRSISPFEDDVPTESIRRAANHLVFTTASICGRPLAKGLFDALEAVASTAYEGNPGSGTVIVASQDHPHVDVAIRLRSPIPVQERLQFRKLLEITDDQLGLLVDGEQICGFGAISEQYDGSTGDLFRFTVVEQGVWMLSHHGEPLLRMAHGHPQLPRPRVDRDLFVHGMRRVFGAVDDGDIHAIWRLAQTAVTQGRGATLVVTTAAAEEARRLEPQALAIEPQPIGTRMLQAMTKIDGAVLLSPDGICHAVGAILDGLATGEGDPGRGARYNSAVRYTAASTAPCLILIVSDDGMIDVHPELSPS